MQVLYLSIYEMVERRKEGGKEAGRSNRVLETGQSRELQTGNQRSTQSPRLPLLAGKSASLVLLTAQHANIQAAWILETLRTEFNT